MTAIAIFTVAGCPVLLGDLIVSGPEEPSRTVGIPTIGRVTDFFPEGSGWTITGFQQKVTIVSDECAIAWSGSHLGACVAIEKMRERAKSGRITRFTVSDLFASLRADLASLDTTLLGFVVDSDGPFQFAFGDFDKCTRADGSKVLISGTGAEYLKKTLARGDVVRAWGENSAVHPAERAFEKAILTGGSLLRTERPLGFTLRRYFGGSYEAAVWNGERFTKDASITYILWDGRDPDQYGFAHPTRLISHLYDNGHLLMRVQELTQTAPGKFKFGECSLGIVQSMNRDQPYDQPITTSRFQHDPRWICHCFLVARGGKVQPFSMLERCYPAPGPYSRFETHRGIVTGIHMKGAFWRTLQQVFDAWPHSELFPAGQWALCSDA